VDRGATDIRKRQSTRKKERAAKVRKIFVWGADGVSINCGGQGENTVTPSKRGHSGRKASRKIKIQYGT